MAGSRHQLIKIASALRVACRFCATRLAYKLHLAYGQILAPSRRISFGGIVNKLQPVFGLAAVAAIGVAR